MSAKSWRSPFGWRRSQHQHDAESSSGSSRSSREIDSDAVSIASTRPPSYRSEATVRLPGYSSDEDDDGDEDAATPPATPRVQPASASRWNPFSPAPATTLPILQGKKQKPKHNPFAQRDLQPPSLSTLPFPVLEQILSHLPIHSRLCLKYTNSTLYHRLPPSITSALLLGDPAFHASPTRTWHERALLLAHLETSHLLPHPTPTPAPSKTEKPKPSPTLLTCSACSLLHPTTAFAPSALHTSPFTRSCTGSTRILKLCAHASLTWSSYAHGPAADLHFVAAIHGLRLIEHTRLRHPHCTQFRASYTPARDGEERAMVRRHYGSECRAWEGEAVVRDGVPRGTVRFQVHPGPGPAGGAWGRICVYACWSMSLGLVWDSAEVRGGSGGGGCGVVCGPSPCGRAMEVQPLAEEWSAHCSATTALIAALATRLDCFEIYLCPHLRSFSDPALRRALAALVESRFAPGPGYVGSCGVCKADVRLYVYAQTGQFWVTVAREVGTGRSAMEGEWWRATHEGGERWD